jgi:type IX secretion system PorP/SprF family membrane protein
VKATKLVILLALSVLVSTKAGAQYDPHFAHYFDMPTAFNAASAGKNDQLNVVGVYNMSLAGFENSPKTAFIAGDMPFVALKSIHGVGLQLMTDRIGLFNHQRITAQYALRKKLGGGWFSGGVLLGLLNEKFRGSEVVTAEDNDDVFPTSDVDGNALDLGFGLYYSHKGYATEWYAGLSGTHLTSPKVSMGEKYELNVSAMFYATGGVTWQLRNPTLRVATSALLQSDGVTYRGDVTAKMIYSYDKRVFYGGLTYSPTNSITILAGANFHGIMLGYSFEAYTNGISLKNGSHELFIGYQTDIDLGKKGKNYHQTTRTL